MAIQLLLLFTIHFMNALKVTEHIQAADAQETRTGQSWDWASVKRPLKQLQHSYNYPASFRENLKHKKKQVSHVIIVDDQISAVVLDLSTPVGDGRRLVRRDQHGLGLLAGNPEAEITLDVR